MESRYYDCDVSGVRRRPVLSANERREGLHDALVTWHEADRRRTAPSSRRDHLPWVDRELQVLEFLARERRSGVTRDRTVAR